MAQKLHIPDSKRIRPISRFPLKIRLKNSQIRNLPTSNISAILAEEKVFMALFLKIVFRPTIQ